MSKNLVVILGDQLSENISSLDNFDKNNDVVLMMEVANEIEYVNHHKKKLVLIFSAMRHFANELRKKKINVIYVEFDKSKKTFTDELENQSKKIKPDLIKITHPGEFRVLNEIKNWEEKLKIPITILQDTRFFCELKEFENWALSKNNLLMESFYQLMRKKFKILVDSEGKPLGGKWNYDVKNRKSLPKNHPKIPNPIKHEPDDITKNVISLVQKNFSNHYGSLDSFWLATNRKDALKSLDDFISNRLKNFGPYEDSMSSEEKFLYHSTLSVYLNIGLLEPQEVISRVLEQNDIPIESLEGFVRQIIGWREYVRGIYWHLMPEYSESNFFDAKNNLPDFFWTSDTDMNCMKNCLQQTHDEAYAHHIQRLMVIGNFSLIAGLDPKKVSEWYLSVYVDAFEWVELPNTHGMILFADGGILGSKPYAASGNYINKMSDYCKNCKYDVKEKNGKNACPFNYLYWNFFLKNESKIKDNPRLWIVFSNIKKMSYKKKIEIKNDSENFLRKIYNNL